MKNRIEIQLLAQRKKMKSLQEIHSQYVEKAKKCSHIDKVNKVNLTDFDDGISQLKFDMSNDIEYALKEIDYMDEKKDCIIKTKATAQEIAIKEQETMIQNKKQLKEERRTFEMSIYKSKQYLNILQ
jgi:hypothetical protein